MEDDNQKAKAQTQTNPLPAVKNDDGVERKEDDMLIDSGFVDGDRRLGLPMLDWWIRLGRFFLRA